MRTRILAATAVGLALAAGGMVATSALAKDTAMTAPAVADDFQLVDNNGFAQELGRVNDVKAIVIVTQVNGDKKSRAAAASLEALKKQHADVEFLMLNSSLSDTRDTITAEAKAQGWSIPVMDDNLQLVGEQLGVSYAGQAFVIEPKTRKVLYAGPIDKSGAKKKAKGYLAEALNDVKAGKAVQVAAVTGKGAQIAFPERGKRPQHAAISYAKDVAPILEAKCVSCHQDGGIGPFAMANYDVVKGFAPMIRESIRTDRMPPWHPDPTVGKFVHDGSLSADQIKTIVHWVEAGAPRGEGADPLAAVKRTAPEWPLGKPDLVINIPEYTIPASGVVDYQYPTAANPLKEGRWVKAAALTPGDRRGVHHILAGYISGTPRPGPGSAGQWEANYGEYAVGGEAFEVPDGLGIYLPPGGSMGFQMHYTPYGKASADRSKMGFYFFKDGEMPKRVLRHFVIADNLIELPPGAYKHEEVAYAKFPKDALLYNAFLHTHYRGLSGKLEMVKADGSRQMLVNLPRYDFNWQRTYEFAEPVKIPAGSKLVATYLYDNSTRNASNPDPKERVIWGDQSWEEMHYTSIYYQWADETEAKPTVDRNADRNAFSQYRAMGMLDDNLDEKVTLGELRGRMKTALEPRFAELDADKDGSLNLAELNKAQGAIMSAVAAATGSQENR